MPVMLSMRQRKNILDKYKVKLFCSVSKKDGFSREVLL